MVVLAELLSDRPDRTDCVSEAAWSSERSVLCGSLNGGDAGCGGSAGTTPIGVGKVAEPEVEPADGIGGGIGDSPMLVISGVAGFGTKIVFRTSLRPRSVLDRLAGVAC